MLVVEQFEFSMSAPVTIIQRDLSSTTPQSEREIPKPFRYRTLALTSDHLESSAIEEFGNSLKKSEMRWRHNRLEEKPEALLGMVDDVEIVHTKNEKGKPIVELYADCVNWGETDEQEQVITLILESIEKGEPIGHSVGYIKITESESNEIVRVFFRELSVTPYPKCVECVTTLVYNNEQTCELEIQAGGIKMSQLGTANGISSEQFEALKQMMNIQFESSHKVLESRIQQLEKDKEGLQKQLVERDVVTSELRKELAKVKSERVMFESNVRKQKSEIGELELTNNRLTTVPLRIQLAQAEGIKKPDQITQRVRELENKTPQELALDIRRTKNLVQRMEIRSRHSSKARVGTEQHLGKGGSVAQSFEQELRVMTPEQLATKYYGA